MEDNRSFQGSQSFPPGFRFHPTDQELIIHYLRKKISTSATTETATSSLPPSLIADIDIYKFNPWELPEKAFFGEGEWFFFSPRDRKYPNGVRPNRAAACGYWKATGTDKPILAINGRHCLGVKKALVFYKGRPPKGFKTDWVMHEYRLLDQFNTSSMLHKQKGSMRLDDWVLCRVKHKGNMLLPENGGRQEFAAAEKQERNHFDLSDCHLMGYLLGSASQAEFASESSEIVSGGGGGGSFFFEGEQKPELNLVSSMLSSLKRKLSFGALDELMMMPSGKKERQIPAGEQLSPAESESDEQECLEFLL